jgi:branched-chain amino acid transport system ATP-binding protein
MPHTVTAVIGPNGAGKSTLLRAIYGRLRLSAGAVRLRGDVITGLSPGELRRRGLAYVAQGRCNFPMMSVRENLEMAAFIRRDGTDRAIERWPDRTRSPAAPPAGGRPVGGQQRLPRAVMGLLAEPLLLVDEPSMGPPRDRRGVDHTRRDPQRRHDDPAGRAERPEALKLADRGLVLDLRRSARGQPAALCRPGNAPHVSRR